MRLTDPDYGRPTLWLTAVTFTWYRGTEVDHQCDAKVIRADRDFRDPTAIAELVRRHVHGLTYELVTMTWPRG